MMIKNNTELFWIYNLKHRGVTINIIGRIITKVYMMYTRSLRGTLCIMISE